MTFALLGVYVGVIPVFLGLLWLPFLTGISRRWVDFFLSFHSRDFYSSWAWTRWREPLELTGQVASAFQGTGLVVLGVVGTPLLINALSRLAIGREAMGPLGISLLIAVGIGPAQPRGRPGRRVGLRRGRGGPGDVSRLRVPPPQHHRGVGDRGPSPPAPRPALITLAGLGLVAGLPTILGAWIGGFSYSPTASVLFLAIGAGAIIQVIWVIMRSLMADSRFGLTGPLNAARPGGGTDHHVRHRPLRGCLVSRSKVSRPVEGTVHPRARRWDSLRPRFARCPLSLRRVVLP